MTKLVGLQMKLQRTKTAMLHDWNFAEVVLKDKCDTDSDDNLIRERVLSLLPCNVQHTWKQCIRAGQLMESSVLFHKHLGGRLPAPSTAVVCGADSPAHATSQAHSRSDSVHELLCLLKDKDRGGEEVEDKGVHRDTAAAALLSVMQVEDIVVWLQVDILPALRDGIVDECREGDAALLELCTFLLELSRASEACDDHPFNALSVADLVATLSASLSSEELGQECKRVQEEAAVLRQNLYLQASLLQQWNQKLSFAEISTTGLSGALAAHLRSVPEEALLESITLTVRPLILQFNESLDAMLYEWIHETIHSTVISNDSTDAGDSSRETRHADDDSDRNVGWDHQGRGGRGGGRNRDGDTVLLCATQPTGGGGCSH